MIKILIWLRLVNLVKRLLIVLLKLLYLKFRLIHLLRKINVLLINLIRMMITVMSDSPCEVIGEFT